MLIIFNKKPYFPIFQEISEKEFGSEFNISPIYDSYLLEKIKRNGFIIFPLIKHSPTSYDYEEKRSFPSPPSQYHLLGTDDQGRDVLVRLLYSVRISLIFGIILTFFSSLIGICIGAIQGYFAGITDLLLGRFLEIWNSLPQLFILITLSSIIFPSIYSLLCILLLFSWTSLTGVVRTEFLKVSVSEYVIASKALGASDFSIIIKHILPNAMTSSLTYLPFILASSITSISALDFLGLGLPIGTPTLGNLIRQGKENIQAPWIGLSAIFCLIFILSLLLFIGDSIRKYISSNRNYT